MSYKKFTTYHRGHLIVFHRLAFLTRRADVHIYEPGGRLTHQRVVFVGKTEEDFVRNVASELKKLHALIDWRLGGVEERDQEIKWYH